MGGIGLAVIWILAAASIGFWISAIFSAWLDLERDRFSIPYIGLTGVFLYIYFRGNPIEIRTLFEHNLVWGIIAGLSVGGLLVFTVRSHPYSRESSGSKLLRNLAWSGLAYGLIDALFLNVMPVVALKSGFLA
jgi:hypothetical protein